MYNRDTLYGFTEHAIKVLHLAEVERQSLLDSHIGTEHLLLGLIAEKKGLAAKVLNDFSIDLNRVRYQIVFMTSRDHSHSVRAVSLTPHARTMLACAASEALRLNDHSIGTGHLLSGLVRARECTAIDVLESLGVDRVYVRKRTLQLLCRMERSYINPPSFRMERSYINPPSFQQLSNREITTRQHISHLKLVPLYTNLK